MAKKTKTTQSKQDRYANIPRTMSTFKPSSTTLDPSIKAKPSPESKADRNCRLAFERDMRDPEWRFHSKDGYYGS